MLYKSKTKNVFSINDYKIMEKKVSLIHKLKKKIM